MHRIRRYSALAVFAFFYTAIINATCAEQTMIENTWRGLRPGVSQAIDVASRLGPADREMDNVSYGKATGLRMLSYDDLVVTCYVRDGNLLLMVLVPRQGDVFPRIMAEWVKVLGEPPLVLPSRQGKNHRIGVYADKGIAVTFNGRDVTLVELFPPMPLENYRNGLYVEPHKFVK